MKVTKNRVGIALAVSLVLSFLCGFIVYQTMGFVYAIADDIIMRDIVSGAFTGTPDGHLIFVQYFLGWFISKLYLMNGNVDWYGFVIAGSIFLGLAVVLYRGLSAPKGLRWKLVYTVLTLGIWGTALLFHAAQFEWTISAAVLGASALYLYVTMDSQAENRQKQLEGIFIWLLLILTFGIRYDVFFMVMPGFGITFLWKFVKKAERNIRLSYRELVLPVAVFVSIGLLFLVEQFAYRGTEWKEFQRFQPARSQVYDYTGVPSYEENPAFFEGLGLDQHEVRNLRHYALHLVEGMDAKMMEVLSEESQRQSAEATGFKAQVKNGFRLAVEQFAASAYFTVSLPAAGFLLGVIILAWRYHKGHLLPLFLFLCAEGILWLGLGFMGRLPERVACSMHLVLLLGIAGLCFRLWNCAEEQEKDEKKSWEKTVFLLATAVFCVTTVLQWNISVRANEEKLATDGNYQLFKEVCKKETEKLFFIETYMAEPVGGAKVTINGDFSISNCLTFGDWYTTSPLEEERFRMLGIDSVESVLLENPNAYLAIRDAQNPGFYEAYFVNKYPGTELVYRDMEVIEDRTYYLYQIQLTQ